MGGPPLSGGDIWLLPSLAYCVGNDQRQSSLLVSETGSTNKAKVPFTKFKLIKGAVSK